MLFTFVLNSWIQIQVSDLLCESQFGHQQNLMSNETLGVLALILSNVELTVFQLVLTVAKPF